MGYTPMFDFDAQFASPPAHDDSFFLIRYPTATSLLGGSKQNNKSNNITQISATNPKKDVPDWSKHTQPCQQFISGIPFGALSKCPPTIKPKPVGTDDGFKGDGAACGSSIVRVAQQIISSHTNSSEILESVTGIETMQKNKDSDQKKIMAGSEYNSTRRGSKSLPATPLNTPPASPGVQRKLRNPVNRFFTSPFELPADINGSRSWILAGLLGQQRETINEEGSLANSMENLDSSRNSENSQVSNQNSSSQKPLVYRPKPSELREMNFLSPTSM